MTVDSLFDECWAALPWIRKTLAGKDATRRVFIDTLREWDSHALSACCTDYQVERYEEALRSRVERRSKEGFVILTILLIAVASAIISWLVQRWLDHMFPKAEFEAMRVGV